MFSAASCGLVLLCDEALRSPSSDTDRGPSPAPKRKATHTKHVSFCDKDDVLEFECESSSEYLPGTPSLCDSGTEEDVAFGVAIEKRLRVAGFNTKGNRGPFRYQPPVVSSRYKQGHGAYYANGAQVHRRRSAPQTVGRPPRASPRKGFALANAQKTKAIVHEWWRNATVDGIHPEAYSVQVARRARAPG